MFPDTIGYNDLPSPSDRCTRLVRANKKSSMERQADLEEQLQKTRTNYETSTKTYLKQEKVFREEK